jgi:hypothetical protein
MKVFAEAMHEHLVLIKALQAVAQRMDRSLQEFTALMERWGR